MRILILILSIVFLNSSLFAGEEEDFIFASRSFEDKFYEVAARQLEKFITKYPESEKISEAHLLLAQCYYHLDKLLPALSELETILHKPSAKDLREAIFYWIGEVYLKGKDFSTAREYFLRVNNEFPQSSYRDYALHSLALSYYAVGNFKEAIFWWDKLDIDNLKGELLEEVLLQRGKSYFKLGNYAEAKKDIFLFINRFPEGKFLDEAYYYLGEINFKTSDYNQALDNYSQIILHFPRSSFVELARLGIAWIYLNTERYAEAEKYFKSFIEKNRDRKILDSALIGLATALSKLARDEEALKVYERILQEFPQSNHILSAYMGKAEALYNLSRYEETIDFCLGALKKFTTQDEKDDFYYTLGWAYRKLGRTEEALLNFEDLFHYSQDEHLKASALACLGDIYLEKDEYSLAQEMYDLILKDYAGSLYADYAQRQLGIIFYKLGKYEAAIISFRSLISNFPSTRYKEEAGYYIAMSYFNQGKYKLAEEEFIRLSQSKLYAEEAGVKRGVCLINLRKYTEAIDWFRKIRNSLREENYLFALDYYTAWAQYLMGRKKDFLKTAQDILKRYPKADLIPEIIFWLGEYYYQNGDFNKSEEYFGQLINQFPQDDLVDDAYYWLGWVNYYKKDYLSSIKYFEKLPEKYSGSPLVPEALYRKGKILYQLNMRNEAEEVFRELERNFPESPYFYLSLKEQANLRREKKDIDSAWELLKRAESCPLPEIVALIKFDLASILEERGDLDEALTEYLKIVYLEGISEEEMRERAKLHLGQVLEKKEKWREAEGVYQELVNSHSQEIKNLARQRLEELKERLK
ncbi:MAG: tetratricopeptide repeat protein [Candidatus Omnitrophica bacterium]|nr:tetratricopeptide repeat protein [Candidatus Omnitrophota bacterium]